MIAAALVGTVGDWCGCQTEMGGVLPEGQVPAPTVSAAVATRNVRTRPFIVAPPRFGRRLLRRG